MASSGGAYPANSSGGFSSERTPELFREFVNLIAVLRGPTGCPWDREQSHASIAKNMIEEAYEAVDAIELDDVAGMREELGDVLLQVVLQAQMAADAGEFTIDDVVADINRKIVRRHPHVFGPGGTAAELGAEFGFELEVEQPADAEATLALWDTMKRAEKRAAGAGLLGNIAMSQPALALAQDMSKKMVGAGFEWETTDAVIEQVIDEIREFVEAEPGSEHAEEELGDVLFTVVNVARKHGIDAETALRRACTKVRWRWTEMERLATLDGNHIADLSVDEQEALWRRAKETERSQ